MAPQISSVQEVSTRGPGGPRGRRGVGLIVGTVVVALLVAGVVLEDDDASPAAGEREEATTTTRSRPTTTRPRPTGTTTTTLAGPIFAGHDLRGWLLSGGGGGWTLVNLTSGAQVPPDLPFDNPYSTRAVTGGVVLIVNAEARFYDLRAPEDVREPVSLGPADQILTTSEGDLVWLVEAPSDALPDGARARLVDLEGRERRSFQVPPGAFSTLELAPSAGIAGTTEGVLVGLAGRVYLADEGGVRPVAVGDLVGAVGSSFLVFACDDDATSCGIDLRAATGRLIRRLDVEASSPELGSAVSRAADGRFAVVTRHLSAEGDISVVTLHEPDGTTVATVEVLGYLPFAPGWLQGDAGLVGALNGQIVWIHPTPDGWVVDVVPGLTSVQSEGVLPIALP